MRYAKIAVLLSNKTVRDVALRCKWIAVSFSPFSLGRSSAEHMY